MIYIISDVHGNLQRYKKLMKKAVASSGKIPGEGDIVLVLGDLFAASGSTTPEELVKREMQLFGYISQQKYELVSVRGNHDKPKRLYSWHAYPEEKYGNDVVSINSNISFLSDGKTYDIPCGKNKTVKILALGGALTHALRFQQRKDLPTVTRYRATYKNLIHATSMIEVDYVAAHDCPASKMGILGIVFGKNDLNKLLDEINDNIKQKRWFYGHHHTDNDANGKYHCIYNRVITIDDNGIDSISKNMVENDKKRIENSEKINAQKKKTLDTLKGIKASASEFVKLNAREERETKVEHENENDE